MTALPTSLLGGLGSIIALAGALFVLVVVIGLVGTFVIIVVGNRGDPDPTGKRPFVVYLFAVSFVTIWTALIGSSAAVSALFQLIGSHPASAPTSEAHPIGDMVARSIVLGLLVTAVSVWVLLAHVRKAFAVVTGEPEASPSRRVAQTYVSGVAFVSLLILIATVVVFVYSIFQILGPGTFASAGGRVGPFRHLLDSIWVGFAAGTILFTHVKRVPEALSPLASLFPVSIVVKHQTPSGDAGKTGAT